MIARIKKYFQERKKNKSAKLARMIKNKMALREDRQAALEFFQDGTDLETTIPALLARFEYSLEHGINDTREKELAMKGIVHFGKEAIPLIKEHLQNTHRIAWPLKILEKICDQESEIVDVLLSALNFGDVVFDQAIVDKNYDLLCHLSGHKRAGLSAKVIHFIKDADERVRFAAAEVLAAQDDQSVASSLEPFLFDDSSENRRIRKSVMDAFIRNHWKVHSVPEGHNPSVPIIDGIFLDKEGFLGSRV